MNRIAFIALCVFLFSGCRPPPFATFPKTVTPEPASATDPGYFNGLGTTGRTWEAKTTTSFDTNRMLTERLELGAAVPTPISPLVSLAVRASMGANADLTNGYYGIQGPILSLGIRDRSKSANYWVEFGVRMIPNYSAPNDTLPTTQQAAFKSVLSSGIADDAAWLPVSDVGAQVYGAFQTRTDAATLGSSKLFFGARYGGAASLASFVIKTWLGPERGFVGNAYLEVFFGLPMICGFPANVEVGVHGDVSLSSIWPGTLPLPLVGDAFIGWSPKSYFALRVFIGIAGSPSVGPVDNPYGVRLAFFVP